MLVAAVSLPPQLWYTCCLMLCSCLWCSLGLPDCFCPKQTHKSVKMLGDQSTAGVEYESRCPVNLSVHREGRGDLYEEVRIGALQTSSCPVGVWLPVCCAQGKTTESVVSAMRPLWAEILPEICKYNLFKAQRAPPEQTIGFSPFLSWTFQKPSIAKLLFILQTRKCHCTQMKAWPFCSASNPVWALFQLELLWFPEANSSLASWDEKHVFVKVGTENRTGQTQLLCPKRPPC